MASLLIDNTVNRQGLYTRTIFTVATLPAAAANQGCEAFVSDLNLAPITNQGAIATGAGTILARVQSDGTNWRVSFNEW